MLDSKRCTKCKRDLLLEQFHKQQTRPDGKMRWCKECVKQHDKKHYNTPRGWWQVYRSAAARRGIEFTLGFKEFTAITAQRCSYCGLRKDRVGVDRLDNCLGYVPGNVTSCCGTCNRMKSDLSLTAFVDHCVKVAEYGQEFLMHGNSKELA